MAAGEASTAKPRQEKQYDYLLKFLLVGDSDVGKQEILSGLEDGAAESPFCSGSAYKTTTILLDGKRVKLQLWDTSGQGRFCTIIRSYSRGAQGILLVYDITNRWSFDGIDRWLKEVEEHAPGIPKVLVGNRLHLAFKRQVGERDAEAYAAKNRMAFFEVSPLCDFNIRESFSELSRMALHRNGMERLWRSNKVLSLQELACRAIVARTTVYGIDQLPLPKSIKSHLKSYAMTTTSQHRYNGNRTRSSSKSLSSHQRKLRFVGVGHNGLSTPGCVDEENMSHLPNQENDSVPPQLKEVNELLKSINTQLEDCGLEWQAKISQQQWEMFSAKNITHGPWEQSVLARTFFTEKVLDESFQNLLSCSKSFLQQFNNFIVLLQSKQPNLPIQEEQKSLRYCSDISGSQTSMLNPIVEPLDLSLLNYMNSNVPRKKGKQCLTNLLEINSSFADVIKAKITFDTKFLGFEAVLHKMSNTSPSEATLSNFCQICSNESITEKRKAAEITLANKQKKRQTKMLKGKRITGIRRTLTRKCRQKESAPLGDGDQLSAINKSKNETVPP